MSGGRPTSCELFDEHADELALGQVGEPLRGHLLAHAADCPHCHSLLDGLGTVVDRLLLVAPQAEPPAGFENRALARVGAPPAAVVRAIHTRMLPVWVAAVASLVVGAGAVAAVWAVGDRSPAGPASAAIVAASGTEVGTVRLIADPRPHVLVTVDAPRPGAGLRHCELRLAGRWVEVGTWEVADLAAGAWAVGIDADLLDATAMRVVDEDGAVLATAEFD